jgi:hypothetical protein
MIYSAGMSETGSTGLTVSLEDAEPAPPALDMNTWTIYVTDDAGNGVEGADVAVKPTMPVHNHGTPYVAQVDDQGGGTYVLDPVNMFMVGYWNVEITVTTDSISDVVDFAFCIQ